MNVIRNIFARHYAGFFCSFASTFRKAVIAEQTPPSASANDILTQDP